MIHPYKDNDADGDDDNSPHYKHQNTIFAAETHSDAGKKIWWWPLESLSKDNIMGGWWWIDWRTFVLHDNLGSARNDFHLRPFSEQTGSLILYTVTTIVTWEIFIRSKLVSGVWHHHHHRRRHYYTTDIIIIFLSDPNWSVVVSGVRPHHHHHRHHHNCTADIIVMFLGGPHPIQTGRWWSVHQGLNRRRGPQWLDLALYASSFYSGIDQEVHDGDGHDDDTWLDSNPCATCLHWHNSMLCSCSVYFLMDGR